MLLRVLLAGWILALISRLAIFDQGGTFGAYVTITVFWVATFALIIVSCWRLIFRPGRHTLQFKLILLALLALCYRAIVTGGPTAPLSSVLFVGSISALCVVQLRSLWKHDGDDGHGLNVSK